MLYVLIGLLIAGAAVAFWYLAKHHVSPTLPPAKDVATGVLSGLEEQFTSLQAGFAEELSKVPAMVSAEVQRLSADLSAAIVRAEAAEVRLAAELQAREDFVSNIKAQVSAVVATAQPTPAAVPVPATLEPAADPQ